MSAAIENSTTEHNAIEHNAILRMIVYFLLFLAGDLGSGIAFDLFFSVFKMPYVELYSILRMIGALALTLFLFWHYTTKKLHHKMADFGITWKANGLCIAISIILPVSVIAFYSLIGHIEVNRFPLGRIVLIVVSSILIALKSSITEEMLFRGFVMRILERKWNKKIAIIVPSLLFGMVHIFSMETFSLVGILLLIASGTMVGIMFSLAAYKDDTIANSVLLHAVWNLLIITDILTITTGTEKSKYAILTVMAPSDNPLLSGAGFGVEASLVSLIAYSIVCLAIHWSSKRKKTDVQSNAL